MCPVTQDQLVQGSILSGLYHLLLHDRDPWILDTESQGDPKPVLMSQYPRDLDDGSPVLMAVLAKKTRCVLVSQTCDIRSPSKDTIQLAPVYPVRIVPDTNRASSIRRNESHWALYVAATDDWVDLRHISTVDKRLLADAELVGCLTDNEQEFLRVKIKTWFGRPALPNDVVGQLSEVEDTVRKRLPKKGLDANVAHVFLDDRDSDRLSLLVVHHDTPINEVVSVIDQAVDKANEAGPRHVSADHRALAAVSLADIRGLTRFSFDYLSFGGDDTCTFSRFPE